MYIVSMRVKKSDNLSEKERILNDGYREAFGLGLGSFMDRCGLSTKDIAEKLGVTDSSVSSWKYGRAFPDFPNYLKLVILGMSPYEVMNGLLDIHARINDCKMRIERNKMDLNFMRGRSRYSGEEAQLLIAEIEREISELNEQIGELNSQLNNKIDELDKRTLELLRSKGLSNLNMKEENPA